MWDKKRTWPLSHHHVGTAATFLSQGCFRWFLPWAQTAAEVQTPKPVSHQGSSGPRELSPGPAGLAWRQDETQLRELGLAPRHSAVSLLQGRGLAPPAERPLCYPSGQIPPASRGWRRRSPESSSRSQGFGRKQGADCLGATQLMERLCLQGFGCFSSLTPWSRAKETESQRRSGLVCLLVFLPKHSHPPLLSHTASLLWPRAWVSKTQGCCQENLIQPTGGLLSAPLITHPTTASQVLRPPEPAGLTASTLSRSAAPYLRRGDYFFF